MDKTQKRENRRKQLEGIVVSDKMQKTRVVQVTRMSRHRKYNKTVKTYAKYKAHDEKNESKVNDEVRIMETRPLSKEKRWLITNIIKTS